MYSYVAPVTGRASFNILYTV